jgi:hypothetical protein
MTDHNTTPEGFRTAAYLATKARLDARRSRTGKTSRNVTCTPPNVKCGGRCIPPNWDCRIKGQGPDPHLRAVRTDPVSGLANIERGVKRIGKGVRKGSFSEIEGGKRAIVRGVVKATPGDIQRKKALQAQLERRAGGIATATAIIGFGLFSHNQLKRAPFYREGIGRKIDDSVAAGINRVLDATPGIGRARAERRAAGGAVAVAAVSRAAAEAAAGPKALRTQLLGTSNQLETRATAYANSRILFNRLSEVDVKAAALNTNAETWRQQSLEAFWGTKRTGAAGAGDGSTFSEPATHEFLSRQFGFRLSSQATDTDVRRSLTTALNREASSMQALARQQRVNLKDADARQAFLNRLVGPSTANFPENVRERAVSNLDQILGSAPRSREAALSRRQLAERVYRETRDGFDSYFGRVANEVRQTPGVAMPAEQRRRGYGDLMNSARIGHSRYLAKRLSKPENVTSRMGQGLSDVLSREYFATRVNKSSTFTLSDRETLTAASELAGRNITRVGEATRYLQQNGFERLIPVRRAAARRAQAAAAQAPQPRAARRRSMAQRISDLMRQKNPDGSPRYATREAAEAALKRMRGDEGDRSPELVRTVAYLATRNDFKEGKRLGKPCGASHIPKAHKCTKGEGARAAKPAKSESSKINPRAALAVAALGVTAATGAYVINDMKRVAKEPNLFEPTPSTRSVAKAAKKEFDTKKSGTAMGNYYTKKSGLKPGDVVYYRNEKDPAAHFGIYIGEGKDGKVRAVMANTNEKRAGFVDVMELGTTKPDSNDAAHFMFPVLQKAPPLKGAKARTNEETVRRALRAVGTDYKFSLTRDNCEVLANSVAYDTPRSQQLERFKRVTRQVADSTIGVRQRAGMAVRRARGQRKTKALTASQILQRLSKDDNTFLTDEGKTLARTHYSQFFESGAKLDAATPMPAALVSPDQLWNRIKDFDDNKKAIAMRDYLLVLRLALDTNAAA